MKFLQSPHSSSLWVFALSLRVLSELSSSAPISHLGTTLSSTVLVLLALGSSHMSPVALKLLTSESWFPLELECEITLWTIALSRSKPSSYLLISKAIHRWWVRPSDIFSNDWLSKSRLEPILYRVVDVCSEEMAEQFLLSIKPCPGFAKKRVKVLHLHQEKLFMP